jgi:hypothetical protein
MPRFQIEGRNVYHRLGTKTQSVSICKADNQKGVYEERYSLSISVEGVATELAVQPDLAALRDWLALHGGQPLSTDGRPGDGMPALLEATVADGDWMTKANAAVERVLDSVVDQLRDTPYLHRVEHSLHAMVWSLLKQERDLQGEVPLKDEKTRTQLVHKEWPETIPRKKPDGTDRPRGLFDLAILSPQQVRLASVEQLVFGRIEAPVVIEVGLDYGLQHLADDAAKLAWSKVPSPYLLHLSRLTDKKHVATERQVCDASHGIRTAYAHIDPRSGAHRWKHVHDAEVSPSTKAMHDLPTLPVIGG